MNSIPRKYTYITPEGVFTGHSNSFRTFAESLDSGTEIINNFSKVCKNHESDNTDYKKLLSNMIEKIND